MLIRWIHSRIYRHADNCCEAEQRSNYGQHDKRLFLFLSHHVEVDGLHLLVNRVHRRLLLRWLELCAVVDVDDDLVLDMNQHFDFPVHTFEFAGDRD